MTVELIIKKSDKLFTGGETKTVKKEEKTEITRNKIFTAAMHEFGSKGYALGAINNICKTGINKGLIYHNFKDKDELYLECVKKSCSDLIGYVTDHNGLESFARYMRVRKEFFQEKEAEAYIFLEARTNPPGQLDFVALIEIESCCLEVS